MLVMVAPMPNLALAILTSECILRIGARLLSCSLSTGNCRPLLPGHNPPPFNFIDDCLPILAPFRSLFKFGRKTALRILEHNEEALRKQAQKKKKRKHKKDVYTGSCVPQELVFHFSAYIALLNRRKTIDSPLVTALLNANAMLSDAMSGLERVLTSE